MEDIEDNNNNETRKNVSSFQKFRRSRLLVIIVVFIAIMLDVMLMTSIDPILPSILRQLELKSQNVTTLDNVTDDHAHQRQVFAVGIMVAAKPGTEMISNLIVGVIVDKWGHRVPMLLGCVFNVASTVGFAFGERYWVLLVTRVAQAVGSSLSVVAGLAFMSAAFPNDDERAKANSIVFSGLSLGIIVGYPYGSTVYQFLGKEAPFLILAGLAFVDGLLRLLLSSHDNKPTKKELESVPRSTKTQSPNNCSAAMAMLADPHIAIGLLCSLLVHLGLGVFLATGPAWFLDRLHAKQWQIGVVLAVPLVFHILAQTVTGAYAVRLGRWIFCFAGILLFAAGMALYPLCTSIWHVLGPEIVVRLGHGTSVCVISPLLAHIADVRHGSNYGLVYGFYTASYNLGLTAGPILGGYLMSFVSFGWLYWGTAIIMVALAPTTIAFRKFSKKPKSNISNVKDIKDYGTISS